MNTDEILFPYEKVRDAQRKLLAQANHAVRNRKNLIAHAPTGMGKTAAVLTPALKYAMENDKIVFFLTSRHTQHQIAIQTMQEIKDRHGEDADFNAVDVVGKKWLCLQDNVTQMSSGEFAEFCRKMREDDMCEFYNNLKKGDKLSRNTKNALKELKRSNPQETEEIVNVAGEQNVCPYEVSMLLSQDSHVVVTDYFYIFNPGIRDPFMQRTGKELEDAIIIVDEAHNLPSRLKNLSSKKLSNIVLKRAISEANDYGYEEISRALRDILEVFEGYGEDCDDEIYVEMRDFWEKVDRAYPYDELVEDLEEVGGEIREEERQSYLASVGEFLEAWEGSDKGFARIFSVKQGKSGPIFTLSYRCLDPSLVTKDVISRAHSTIMMSGTLSPTHMYREVLGLGENTFETSYENPFPDSNRLSMVVPETSTKYTRRGEKMYKRMAEIIADCVNAIPGNSTVFFPSYQLKSDVYDYLEPKCEKTVFNEVRGMSKKEKHDFLQRFKQYSSDGAVLLGVASGSFGEGIDLPGDYLKGVIIVGLPLQKPDLEVESLIDYYDDKFGKGWDYGYLFPAFNRTMQSAGRCIRSETDRGVIVFLDERYTWDNYRRCFPPDMQPEVTMDYERKIKDFFEDDLDG